MKLRFLFSGFLMLFACSVWSQKNVEQGHKAFQNLAYSDAVVYLEQAVEQGFGSVQIYAELADSYYFNANYQASAKWYQLLFEKATEQSFLHQFRYGQSLKSIGKYTEAAAILRGFQNSELLEKIDQNSGRFKIELARFNSTASDFGPAFYGNQIVFASTRDTGTFFNRKHSWTHQSFTDLYRVEGDSTASKPIRMSKEINSKWNESSAVFTKDGLTMYFTRNDFGTETITKGKDQTAVLKIYKAIKVDNKWAVLGELPFCSAVFNTAHPALSFDERTLYFSSDMPGGYGQSDLYQVPVLPDGSFGTPQNLGATINTLGRETFPFCSQNNELYFASDGHSGWGGLDVFVASLDQNAGFSIPENLGEPLNSPVDDFGFIIHSALKTGYFTSNRSGVDNIYFFEELLPLTCNIVLKGKIAKTPAEHSPSNIEITLLDRFQNKIKSTISDENGNYSFSIDCDKKYTLKFESEGYVSQNRSVEPYFNPTMLIDEIVLQKVQLPFQIGDDLAKKRGISPIYFALGKFDIQPNAAVELNKIKEILIEFPFLTIDIRSHTDSRDTSINNQVLSTKRANATLEWFVKNGIDAARLSSAGYGESQLLNDCGDGTPCSEEAHQLNRRSEFIVTGI